MIKSKLNENTVKEKQQKQHENKAKNKKKQNEKLTIKTYYKNIL